LALRRPAEARSPHLGRSAFEPVQIHAADPVPEPPAYDLFCITGLHQKAFERGGLSCIGDYKSPDMMPPIRTQMPRWNCGYCPDRLSGQCASVRGAGIGAKIVEPLHPFQIIHQLAVAVDEFQRPFRLPEIPRMADGKMPPGQYLVTHLRAVTQFALQLESIINHRRALPCRRLAKEEHPWPNRANLFRQKAANG
jgi:hypothetical protein